MLEPFFISFRTALSDDGGRPVSLKEQTNPVTHDVIDPIKNRWSPRAFSDKPVETAKLLSVLEAARWAASSFNEQPWRFVVATREKSDEYERLLGVIKEKNQTWAKLAPVLMLVLAKKTFSNSGGENRHALHDVGQAVATLSLQAAALELYVHQMAGILPNKAREVFGVPDDMEVVSALALGYLGDVEQLPEDLQAKERRERSRKPLTELMFTGRFGQAEALVEKA